MTHEPPVTVLIVDDEVDIRALVRVVLSAAHKGIDVVAEAVDGLDALAVFDDFGPPPVPTVVVLDNRMPEMTGFEVAREMRRRVPLQHIILFSAFVTPEVEAEAREIGIDVCVSKSDAMRLPEIVLELAGTHRGDAPG